MLEVITHLFHLAGSGILSSSSMFHWPRGQKKWHQLAWLLVWPIHLVFLVTIPDCEKPRFKRWFPLTFLMCIIWIGSLSYVVAWMITIIGEFPSSWYYELYLCLFWLRSHRVEILQLR
jgi:hypothetical protein